MGLKKIFNTNTYKNIFSQYLLEREFMRDNAVLVDMDEPMGDKISVLYAKYMHNSTVCKAFVATTDSRILIAVFDIYGKFYKCYAIPLESINNLNIKKVFGGMQISFDGISQYGRISVNMYAASRQFGTDLKEQKRHIDMLVKHLSEINGN